MKGFNAVSVDGNDAVESGTVKIEYYKDASVSPLHIAFTRDDGYECSIAITHSGVKELLKLIVNNM